MPSVSHLHFDCYSGISGDMTLGALVDLGAPLAEIEQRLRGLPIGPFKLRGERVKRAGITGTRVHVEVEEEHHVHRHLADIYRIVEAAGLPPRALDRARRAYYKLAEAEAHVHGSTPEGIHFHEVGAKDAILDIAATMLALELLGVETVSTGSVTVGFGMVQCAHGLMPIPAPATAELLRGIPQSAGSLEGEMVTPTGAAILRALLEETRGLPGDAAHDHHHERHHAHSHEHEHGHEHPHSHHHEHEHGHGHDHHHHEHTHAHVHDHPHEHEHQQHGHEHHHEHSHADPDPHARAHAEHDSGGHGFQELARIVAPESMRVERIGYGAGAREYPGRANFLRLSLAVPERRPAADEWPLERHPVLVLETEIDDMSPEVAGFLMDRLLGAGAFDVQLQAVQMKKNRPGLRIRVICDETLEQTLGTLLFRETSTFGVRRQPLERWCLGRRIETVATPLGEVEIKLGLWGDEVIKASPEYESCRALAERSGRTLSEVYELARAAAAVRFKGNA